MQVLHQFLSVYEKYIGKFPLLVAEVVGAEATVYIWSCNCSICSSDGNQRHLWEAGVDHACCVWLSSYWALLTWCWIIITLQQLPVKRDWLGQGWGWWGGTNISKPPAMTKLWKFVTQQGHPYLWHCNSKIVFLSVILQVLYVCMSLCNLNYMV